MALKVACRALGFSGYTTGELRTEIESETAAAAFSDVDILLVMAGTNDVGTGFDITSAVENLLGIHR